MAQGKNNAAVAAALVLSERAVEKHINSIFFKLGLSEETDVHRRVKAVLCSWRHELNYPGQARPRGVLTPQFLWCWPSGPFRRSLAGFCSCPPPAGACGRRRPGSLPDRGAPGGAGDGRVRGRRGGQIGEEAVEAVARLNPQLVLMDINMEGMGGIAATKLIRDEHKGTNVILLSTYDEEDLPADARTCGALAYIHKERFGPTSWRAPGRRAALTVARPTGPTSTPRRELTLKSCLKGMRPEMDVPGPGAELTWTVPPMARPGRPC